MAKARRLVRVMDTPIYSKVLLDASGAVRFFTVPGPTSIASITATNQIDQTADFECHVIGMGLLPSAFVPWDAAGVALLAAAIGRTWILFNKNNGQKIWADETSDILKMPAQMPAAVSGYDISKSTYGEYPLQEPITIPGGQAIDVEIKWETTPALDLTGLTATLTLFGFLKYYEGIDDAPAA